MEVCIKCEVFARNFQEKDSIETLGLISIQFEDYKRKVLERTKQLEEANRKLTEFKLTSVYILRELDKKSKELMSAKNYINDIIDSITDSLIVVDLSGTIKVVNQAVLNLLGYSEDKLVGKPIDLILKERKGFLFFEDTIMKKFKKQTVIKNYNTSFITKEKKEIPMNISGAVVKDENGFISDIVFIGKDMREINELVKDLEEARSNLERKVEERTQELRDTQNHLIQTAKMATIGQFAAGIAHEINNPLGAIINYVRATLANPEIKGENRGNIELTLKGLFRIENIVKQILDYSGRQKAKLEIININQLIKDTIPFVQHKLSKQKLELTLNLNNILPEIIGDSYQIQQVFLNIINNAIDALHTDGKLKIETSSDDKQIEIKFIDNGKGIKEENLDKIFDPFYTEKEVGEGTGLGLFMSYNIIQSHQGTINIESKEGKGTTVTVSFPVKKQ